MDDVADGREADDGRAGHGHSGQNSRCAVRGACYRPPVMDSGKSSAGGRTDRAAAAVLFLLGLWVAFGPGFLGWDYIRAHNLEPAVLRLLTGFAFLFLAGGLLQRQRAEHALADVHRAMNMLLYGRNYERDREAVRILLRALRSKDAEVREKAWRSLKGLTGSDFALDAGVWEAWWQANEKHFAIKAKRTEEKGGGA